MAESKRKSKMISLRLSSEEYESLRAIYGQYGTRSVSEFARQAMQKVIAGTASPQTSVIKMRLDELDGKMNVLDREVTRLVEVLEKQLSVPSAEPREA
ncbi:MAG TPA: hypothetical protein DEQ47_02610 [Solibacterales bacterium]|nr:hypothetical protein [Bryobacterales bacterium]